MNEQWDRELARRIDHTVLAATATSSDADRVCDEAVAYNFATAVVAPFYAQQAVQRVDGALPICSVVSFPLGADAAGAKVDAARRLLDVGVGEIDMVMNVGAFLAGDVKVVRDELDAVMTVCRDKAILKVIIETAYLDARAIAKACEIAAAAEVDFVKTSTGFAPSGASVENVALMRSVCPERILVKAAGGIRSRQQAHALIAAGASRIGCSASIAVVTGR